MHWSYNLGSKAIDILTKNAKEFTRSASMLGVFIVGALTSNYGATSLAIDYLIKKRKWSPVACIGLLLLIGIIGGFFGIFAV